MQLIGGFVNGRVVGAASLIRLIMKLLLRHEP